jgi:hypothetical protein
MELYVLILPERLIYLFQSLDKSIFKVFKQKYCEKLYEFEPFRIKQNKWS